MSTLRAVLFVVLAFAMSSCGSCGSVWLSLYRARGGGYGATHSTPASTTLKQPVLVPIAYGGGERYQLVKPWSFTIGNLDQPVPLGLVVDGASVPRAVWSFMPPDGLHRAAALAHDWTYINQGHLQGITLTREQADQMFYNLMVQAGVSPARAGIAYRAVRLGGWHAWDSLESPIILPADLYQLRRLGISRVRHLYSAP